MAGPLPGSGPGGLGRCVLAPDGLAPSDCAGQGAGYVELRRKRLTQARIAQALGVSGCP
ncbi:hypothetical protein L549_0317 [Bordetella pertussis H939]|nr:hypothetical protein L549_0317 [Bordetella pertussis H939]